MFSFGIFIVAAVILAVLVVLIATDIIDLSTNCNNGLFDYLVAGFLFFSSIMFLVCSFSFNSFRHMFWSFKYGDVFIYEYTLESYNKGDLKPKIDIDKIVYKQVSNFSAGPGKYVTVYVARDLNKKNEYDKLVAEQDRLRD